MEDSVESSETRPVYILLPICIETKHDMFFNILKNIISRSKLDDHFLDNALKIGMKAENITLELEDTLMNWNELDSKEQRIRQSKIIGFWAIENFPALGKKFFGRYWRPPQRGGIHINQSEEIIDGDGIDALVFQKLKLRVFELTVEKSTLTKLKDFVVNLPSYVVRSNVKSISTKIKVFEIDDGSIEECFKALKSGKFSTDVHFERENVSATTADPKSVPHGETLTEERQVNRRLGSHSMTAHKRTYSDVAVDGNVVEVVSDESIRCHQLVLTHKRVHLDNRDVNVNSETVTSGESRIDSIQAVLLELRKDIGHLSDSFHSTVTNDRNSLHVMVINDKNEEIVRLKARVEELQQANHTLTSDQSKSIEIIEKHTTLINALQQGIDATSKLHVQSEQSLAENIKLIEKLNFEKEEAKKTNEELQHKISSLNSYVENMVAEFHNQIEKVQVDNAAAEKNYCEVNDQNRILLEEVHALRKQSTTKDEEVKNLKITLSELHLQISSLEQNYCEVNDQNRILLADVQTLREQSVAKDDEVKDLKGTLSELHLQISSSEQNYCEVNDQNRILLEDVQTLREQSAAKDDEVKDLRRTLSELHLQISSSEQNYCEVNDQNRILLEDVRTLREQSAAKDDEVKDLRRTLSELHLQISSSEQNYCEVNDQNRILLEDVRTLREQSAAKDDEVKDLRRTLSELHLHVSSSEAGITADVQTQTDLFDELQMEQSKNHENGCTYTMCERNDSNNQQASSASSTNDHASDSASANDQKASGSASGFVSDDPIVNACREDLKKLNFGWIKFQPFKNAKYYPGFVHPPDADGIPRAQKITATGYISNEKNEYFDMKQTPPEPLKVKSGNTFRNKFNQKFNLSYI